MHIIIYVDEKQVFESWDCRDVKVQKVEVFGMMCKAIAVDGEIITVDREVKIEID